MKWGAWSESEHVWDTPFINGRLFCAHVVKQRLVKNEKEEHLLLQQLFCLQVHHFYLLFTVSNIISWALGFFCVTDNSLKVFVKLKWDVYRPKQQQKHRRWKLGPTIWRVQQRQADQRHRHKQDGGALQQTVVHSVQADKRSKAPICTGQQGAKYHRELGPVISTGWVGQSGASAHGSAPQQWLMEWLLPRQGCRTAVIREQEGGVGAAVPEAVTPALAARATHTARCGGRKEAEISKSMSEIAAKGKSRSWQTKAQSWRSVSDTCRRHTGQMCSLVNSSMKLRDSNLNAVETLSDNSVVENKHHLLFSNVCHVCSPLQ